MKDNTGRQYGFDTLSIHGGLKGKNPCNSLNAPIFQTSTFTFDSMEHVDKVMAFESDDYVYTRGNNPTLRIFEDKITVLEEGNGAVAFASGMAAISSVLFSLLKPSDNVIVHKTLYGSSYNVVTKVLPKYKVGYKVADLNSPECLRDLIDGNTKVIYFETPSNPNLDVIDIRKVVEIAGSRNVKVVIDNTFATPFFQKPLSLGADVVVHSTTKYLCGHGDAIGGVAVSKDADYIHELRFDYMSEFGGVMSPFNAWLLLRGIKTLGVRMRQHEKNAMETAVYLQRHHKIKEVMYPGLESFRGYSVAKKQMSGFGAMLSFEVDGGIDEAKKLVNSVKLAKIAVSLGDCESLIEVPAAMTHRGYPKEQLEQFGLTESMVRISVGLENAEDIIEDLEQALSCL
ncbi:MAG: methionine gamma-lyase [Clostridia bacterium BRH_c25]|nr:MAG: methionine gamma-lyase [Clostridia bacterium BRH_c25]